MAAAPEYQGLGAAKFVASPCCMVFYVLVEEFWRIPLRSFGELGGAMKLRFKSISLMTLLLLPLCFGLGWWARGLSYERDVIIAAETMTMKSQGDFIPELDLVIVHGDLAKKFKQLSPEAEKELQRRIDYSLDKLEKQDHAPAEASIAKGTVTPSSRIDIPKQPTLRNKLMDYFSSLYADEQDDGRTAMGILDSLGSPASGSVDPAQVEKSSLGNAQDDATTRARREAFFDALRARKPRND